MPFIDDYGGNRYGKRRYRTLRGSGNESSFRCDQCGAIRYVTTRELNRAARPRCLKCGGMLLETAAESKRHEELREHVVPEQAYRCKACGTDMGQFRSRTLICHLMVKSTCLQYYVKARHVFHTEHEQPIACIYGTAYIEKNDHPKYRWKLTALSSSGEMVTVCWAKTKCDVLEAFRNIQLESDVTA